MMELLLPSRTKNVPIMEVRMHMPAMASGNSISADFVSPEK